VGDGSLIDKEIAFITDMSDRVVAFKSAGSSADDVASRLLRTLEDDYPERADNGYWPNRVMFNSLVSRLYLETTAPGENQDAQHSDLHVSGPEGSTSGCGCAEALTSLYGPAQV